MKSPSLSSLSRSFITYAIFCSSMALSVPLLNWVLIPNFKAHYLLITYLYSLVYANCIGGLLFQFVPRVWVHSKRYAFFLRWFARGATVVTGTTVGCLIANSILLWIVRGNYDYRAEFLSSIKISLMLSFVTVAFIATFDNYKFRLQASAMELKQKELERERAVTLMTQMRLSSLESRVHPHFLFNTLNSISSLIHEDPQRAEDIVTRMAALLRFSLESSQPGLVPVERELSIVKDYLEIEKARFASRLRYQIDRNEGPWLQSVLVPPLSIQTLVENCIKYAVNARREGALIRILLRKEADDCVVEVQDDGPGFSSLTLAPGHGLDSLEERLTMLFGDSGRLKIHSTPKQTAVSFRVPCEERSGVRSEYESATRISGG